jgi:hypothetical protein
VALPRKAGEIDVRFAQRDLSRKTWSLNRQLLWISLLLMAVTVVLYIAVHNGFVFSAVLFAVYVIIAMSFYSAFNLLERIGALRRFLLGKAAELGHRAYRQGAVSPAGLQARDEAAGLDHGKVFAFHLLYLLMGAAFGIYLYIERFRDLPQFHSFAVLSYFVIVTALFVILFSYKYLRFKQQSALKDAKAGRIRPKRHAPIFDGWK